MNLKKEEMGSVGWEGKKGESDAQTVMVQTIQKKKKRKKKSRDEEKEFQIWPELSESDLQTYVLPKSQSS